MTLINKHKPSEICEDKCQYEMERNPNGETDMSMEKVEMLTLSFAQFSL